MTGMVPGPDDEGIAVPLAMDDPGVQQALRLQQQARMNAYLHAVAEMASYVTKQEMPADEQEARTLLQQYLQSQFPTADQLEQFQRAVQLLGGMAPNLESIIQLEAQRRVEALAQENGG